MRYKKQKKTQYYLFRIQAENDNIRRRIEELADRSGKLMYAVTREALELGLDAIESRAAGK